MKQANPFSGITVESLARKRSSPTMTLQHWRRFVCNLATRSTAAAITEAEWFAAATDERIPAGEPVWLGPRHRLEMGLHGRGAVVDPRLRVPPPRPGEDLDAAS